MSEQWTSGAYPAVPPDEKFRHDLQRALEQTHRQQMAQRKLGAQDAERHGRILRQAAGVALLLLALLLVARWLRSRRHTANRT